MTIKGLGSPKTIPAYIFYPLPNSIDLDDPQQGPVMGRLFFSAVEQENHVFDSDITEHAVEKGSNITDHVRPNPFQLTLQVYASNEPIEDFPDHSLGAVVNGVPLSLPTPNPAPGLLAALARDATAFASNVGTVGTTAPPISANVLQFTQAPSDYSIPVSVLNKLLDMRDNATLVNLITPIADYDNMVIQNVTVPRDAKTGTGLRLTIVFRQLSIVESQIVTAPKIPKAQPKQSSGTITLQEYTPPPDRTSLLDRLFKHSRPTNYAGNSTPTSNFTGAGATGDF